MVLKVFLFFLNLSSAAMIDYNGSTGLRWLPKSAGVWGGVGANFGLWGVADAGSGGGGSGASGGGSGSGGGVGAGGGVFYGYFRPVLKASSSVTVNQLQLELNFFPVSFFGVSTSAQTSYRAKNFDDLPCAQYLCTGNVMTEDFKIHLILGYERWFMLSQTQFAWVEMGDKSTDFIDENTMILNHRSGDRNLYSEISVGYKLDARWNAGVNLWDGRTVEAVNSNRHRSVFLSYKRDENLSYVGGVGFYESTLQSRDVTFYGVIRWQGGESLALVR